MTEPARFVPFGASHLTTLAVIFLVSIGLPLAVRRWGSDRLARRLATTVAVLGVLHELYGRWAWVAIWHQPLVDHLPLHICGAAVFLTAVLLIWRSHRVYEVVYFWGLAGALQAMLTPEMPFDFPHPIFLGFFTSHGLILFGLCYATLVFRLRPTWSSIPRAFAITLMYTFLVVAPLNLLLDTNYMYLRGKPASGSVLDLFGPWPWYIAGTAAFTYASFVFYYLPFFFRDRFFRRPTA